MPSRPLLIGGVLLLVLGLLGEFLIFPMMLASNGDNFADQISISGDTEIFNDYDVSDTVIIVDTIARIQICNDNANQTCIWLKSIDPSAPMDKFRFSGDLLDDFRRNHEVVITFKVVQIGSGETAAGYETSAKALSADTIVRRYSTTTELAFAGLAALGLGLVAFGGFNSWRGGGAPEDDRGAPVAPATAPMAAPPAMAPAAPVMAAAAPAAAAPVAQPITIQCPACQAGLQINDPTRPLNITCPACQAGMVVR
jgi:hypothetical protein